MTETETRRSNCVGPHTITTKVDRDMFEWVDTRADRSGIPRTEFMRRLLDLYQNSKRRELSCPACSQTLDLSPAVEQ